MKIEDLKTNRIVTKDGHFMPLVFVDMSIPTAAIAVGAVKLGNQIEQEFKDNKKSVGNGYCQFAYNYINPSHSRSDLMSLATSIDDINI